MQAPTVAETPQIQALEPARPDQSRDDGRAFAKVLENSLAPARRERPTAVDEPDRAVNDQTEASSEDAPAQSKDQTDDIPPEAAENAAASAPPVVAPPAPVSGIDITLALNGQLAISPAAELAHEATSPVIAMSAVGGPAAALMAETDATGTTLPAITSPTLDTVAQSGSAPAAAIAAGPAIDALVATDDTTPLLVTPSAPASSAAAANISKPVPATDDAETTVSASPAALALAASMAPAPVANSRPTAATAKSVPDDDAVTVSDDAVVQLAAPPTINQPQQGAFTAPDAPLAAAFAATNAASKATSATDDTSAAPTAAMPQPAITPTTNPATAAGAALGNQTKTVLAAKDEDEPLDLQTKSTSTATPTPTPASTSASNAPVPAGPTRDTAPTTPTQLPNPMERAVAQQVGRTLVQHLPNGERMMVLRLTPPELGTVRIEVIEHQGVLRARLSAEDDGVRLALERTLPQMRQELRASDAPIRELTLTDQSQFQRPDSQGQTQRQQDQQAERRQRSGEGFSLDIARSEPLAPPRVRDLGIRIDAEGIDALA